MIFSSRSMDTQKNLWQFPPLAGSHRVQKMNSNKDQDIEVIVIEDDIDVQDLLKAYFLPRGYSMTFFNSPAQLIDEANKRPITADVIITDMLLPDMSGLELMKTIRNWGLTLPMIMITSKSSIQTAFESIQAGAFDFIVKPLHLPQLEVSVQRAVHFKQILHENSGGRQTLREQNESTNQNIVAKSQGFKTALDLARRVAHSHANVLITGESGTGKEVIATTIHKSSPRNTGPFVAINCAAIPETLLEAELFGYAKGSFTGAIDKKVGLFEEAEGGTLFLDEIGDMPLSLQSKLLRVLQDRKIKRIGENKMRDINVRIVSATHRNLKLEVHEGRFREDLFFRLNVIPIHIPPLRERIEDIIPLAEFFLQRHLHRQSMPPKRFSSEAVDIFLKHNWSGNVRELENTIERAAVLSCQDEILPHDLLMETPPIAADKAEASESTNTSRSFLLEEIVKEHIIKTLEFNRGAKDKTAKMLGIDRKTLYRKLNEYGY